MGIEKMKTLTILDFEKGKVFQHNINDEGWSPDNESCEDFMINQGYSLDNIQWMVHEDATIYVK